MKFVLKALIIWTVVIAIAVAVTFLCIRFGPEMPVAPGSEYRATGGGPKDFGPRDKNAAVVISKPPAVVAVVNLTAAEFSTNVSTTTDPDLTDGKRGLKNDLTADGPSIRTSISRTLDKDLVPDVTVTTVFSDKPEATVGDTEPYRTNTNRYVKYLNKSFEFSF